MSNTKQAPIYINVPAGGDLSTKQNLFMTITAGALATAGAGVRVAGVLADKPDTAGIPGRLQILGVALVIAGGSGTAGAVASDASGKAVNATGSAEVVGIAMHDFSAGDEVAVLLTPAASLATGGALEIVTVGAVSTSKRTTLLSVTGTKAYTIGAGLYAGQRKTVQCSVAASTPAGTLTGVFTDTDGTTARTTAAFDAVADQLELEWTGSAWQVLLKTSVTMG